MRRDHDIRHDGEKKSGSVRPPWHVTCTHTYVLHLTAPHGLHHVFTLIHPHTHTPAAALVKPECAPRLDLGPERHDGNAVQRGLPVEQDDVAVLEVTFNRTTNLQPTT